MANYKLVASEGVKADGAIIAPKPLATKATITTAKAKTPELEDNTYDDDDDNDDLDTPNMLKVGNSTSYHVGLCQNRIISSCRSS